MKKTSLLLLLILVSISDFVLAQTADDILGKWQSAHGSGRIQIYKRGNLYFGKIIWLKEPNDETGKPKQDIYNPSKEQQSRPVIGLEVLKNFTYKGNGVWANGEIYDPKTGRTFNCQMNIHENDKLNIRAYFGINLLGKTETWTRIGS